MKSSNPSDHEEMNLAMLQALKNLGNAERLNTSSFISSYQVQGRVKDNAGLTPPEALREILAELLELFDVGAKEYAEILRMRFWERKTVAETSEHFGYGVRTLQDKQKAGINLLTQWFVLREEAHEKSAGNGQPKTKEAPIEEGWEETWEEEPDYEQYSEEETSGLETVSTEHFPTSPFKDDFEKKDVIQPNRTIGNISSPDSSRDPGLIKFLFLLISPWLLVIIIGSVIMIILLFIFLGSMM